MERHAPPSQLAVSHIRRATRGEPALRDTQPFVRELGGYTHVFAHNGDLGGIERRRDFLPGRFRPVGDTDPELVFCSLLDRLDNLWTVAGGCLPESEYASSSMAPLSRAVRAMNSEVTHSIDTTRE
jgi:glutamine amidotransferase